MSFDRAGLIEACRQHGLVARVVVADTRGSTPREVGAAMLVWSDGLSGTIGGGALEYEAIEEARRNLHQGRFNVLNYPLGPALGQCCGGAVDLLTEVYDFETAVAVPDDVIMRGQGEMPLPVARLKNATRGQGHIPPPQFVQGWMIEPIAKPGQEIWIWGAGHVGRALARVLSPLPDVNVSLIDTQENRFPEIPIENVTKVLAASPERLVPHAPEKAFHLIVTYSHALDLELCHQLLAHGFSSVGLIGSRTKWERFKKRLMELGHTRASIDRIICPIGKPALGKHPQQIAVGVANQLLEQRALTVNALEGNG